MSLFTAPELALFLIVFRNKQSLVPIVSAKTFLCMSSVSSSKILSKNPSKRCFIRHYLILITGFIFVLFWQTQIFKREVMKDMYGQCPPIDKHTFEEWLAGP
jgi:hypothetical protein